MVVGFFKSFGKGLLYIVLFPLILIVLAIYGVYGLIVFVIQLIKMIILFFSGRTLTSDLEEDIKAKAILSGDTGDKKTEEKTETISIYPSDNPLYNTTTYRTVLDEEVKTEETKEEEIEVELDD